MAKQRISKTIFVIMPFRETPTRNKDDLTAFFETNLKERIENDKTLQHRYSVKRSADTFGITDQIVRDLFTADIVICDLSGKEANPNVMYELGIRLAISDKPVILIRELHENNSNIFDVHGYYTEHYSPHQYRRLENHIIGKLKSFETGKETYRSPVLQVLSQEPSVVAAVRRRNAVARMRMLVFGLGGFASGLGSEIASFLLKHSAISEAIDDSVTLLLVLEKNKEEFDKLDWSEFKLRPVSIPSLNAYLIEPPIAGLIPEDIEISFTLLLMAFFNVTTHNVTIWTQSMLNSSIFLLRDTLCLIEMGNAMVHFLTGGLSLEKMLSFFNHFYEATYLHDWIDKNLRVLGVLK